VQRATILAALDRGLRRLGGGTRPWLVERHDGVDGRIDGRDPRQAGVE
jgi:hypothetical protein